MKAKAHITKGKGEEYRIEEIHIDEPKAGEVLVRIVASGVCHTDIIAQNQEYPVPLPAVLGHEGSGVVEKVGDGVTSVQQGDHVALSFSSCGECPSCKTDKRFACEKFFELNFLGTMNDGTRRIHTCDHSYPISNFFGQSSFATYAISNERNVVKVDKDVDLTILGPLGCGIQTGAGAVINALNVEEGSSVAVFGCGGVGLSAIMASKAVGASVIIAVDVHPNRLEFAKELGATHTLNSKEVNVVEEVKKITNDGVKYSVETSGIPAVLKQAVESLRVLGTTAVVGAPPMGAEVHLDINDLLVPMKTVKGVLEGNSVPQTFIPKLIELFKEGKFPFDKLIKVYPFEELNQAVKDSKAGVTIKPVIKM